MRKPAYTHDCDRCRHLGTESVRGQVVDFYACKEGTPLAETVIRYSSEGSDYSAAPLSMVAEIARQSEFTSPYRWLHALLEGEGGAK